MTDYLEKMSNRAYYIILLVTVLISLIAADWWVYSLPRANGHEEAHLTAYRAQGVEAYRSGRNKITTQRHTVQGLRAGYDWDYEFIFRTTVVIGIGAFFGNMLTGVAVFSGFLAFPFFVHRIISTQEFPHELSDITKLAELTGDSMMNWGGTISVQAVWWIIIFAAVHIFMVVFMTPKNAREKSPPLRRPGSEPPRIPAALPSSDHDFSWMQQDYEP